jgi:hypothetical protein
LAPVQARPQLSRPALNVDVLYVSHGFWVWLKGLAGSAIQLARFDM